MSKIAKTLMIFSLLLSAEVMANWQKDATSLDSATGTATNNTIVSYIADIGVFAPPLPCIDPNIPQFQLGTPAVLNCTGGGSSTPPPPPVGSQSSGSGTSDVIPSSGLQ